MEAFRRTWTKAGPKGLDKVRVLRSDLKRYIDGARAETRVEAATLAYHSIRGLMKTRGTPTWKK